ncbi:serine/threonine protein phosphatase [Chromobacterium sp. Panama]|nr:serine/threonine protein phosphatase [Chromobacterium sp. Panama]
MAQNSRTPPPSSSMILKLQRNTQGRDWAVGDIHGCFRQLSRLLKMAAFNPECDRLLSVGDMIDRGADSAAVLEWLAQPWFYAVRGNHEQLAIDSILGDKQAEIRHVNNGGSWLLTLPAPQRQACLAAFQRLPYAIEVSDADGGKIGVVHADCPGNDWDALAAGLANGTLPESGRNVALWSRERARHGRGGVVRGVDLLLVGHTPQTSATRFDNVLNLDTGAVYGGKLTLFCLNDFVELSLPSEDDALLGFHLHD